MRVCTRPLAMLVKSRMCVAEAHAEGELAGLVVEEAHARVDEELDDGVGVLFGDLLDFDAALRAAHDDDGLGAAVDGRAQVVFFVDVGGIGHEHALDDLRLWGSARS